MDININVIKELISSLGEADFDSLNLETKDFKLKIERGAHGEVQTVTQASAPVEQTPAGAAVTTEAKAAAEKKKEVKGTVLKSPIVGTFYTAPSPDKPAFSTVGQKVKRGDTLYIVESMKLMNEVAGECDGTVAEIYVTNGEPVEFNQPIMRIE